jgi:hypothetical protein
MEITLTKKRTYKLEPFGKFVIKSKTRQGHLPNIIPLDELHITHDTTMPMTPEQNKEIVKLMKKHKTDILVDNNGYLSFYTRCAGGFTQVWHKKLSLYREDENFRMLVDNGHSWGAIMMNSK